MAMILDSAGISVPDVQSGNSQQYTEHEYDFIMNITFVDNFQYCKQQDYDGNPRYTKLHPRRKL